MIRLALKSLWNRKQSAALAVVSIALSSALLLTVEKTRESSKYGFTQAVSGVDLIVGARTGSINLVLYTVFNLGSAPANVSFESFEEWSKHPSVEWVIPYSLGDSHRGFRVVGTDERFYKHYRYRGDHKLEFAQGSTGGGLWDVVLGAEVAAKLKYELGQSIVVTHGVTRGEGFQHHSDKPFRVAGILKSTGTPIDRSLYVTLKGIEAMHLDWQQGAPPIPGKEIKADDINEADLRVESLSAFFLRTKNRTEILRLQRELNNYEQEALLAVIPGATLAELWQNLGYFETALQLVSWAVILVAFLSVILILLASLNERRREMAILRSLGASPYLIGKLLVLESFVLTLGGVSLGILTHGLFLLIVGEYLANHFGISLGSFFPNAQTLVLLAVFLGLGVIAGLWPAWRARGNALKDGLTIKV